LKQFATFAALMLIWITAHAFEINPEFDRAEAKRFLRAVYHPLMLHLTDPTHEELTLMSLQCAEHRGDFAWCDLAQDGVAKANNFESDALVAGARWNDDPNNFFAARRPHEWFFWLEKARAASVYPGNIGFTYPLEYRSHYGDLQFLHAMGRKADAPGQTHDAIVEWAHFAYDVAAGRIALSTRLSDLARDYSFAARFAGIKQRPWTVRKLFTNISDSMCSQHCELEMSDAKVRALALGALLHTIQDSFSHSHASRSGTEVVAWLDYTKQNSDCHGKADQDTAFMKDADIKSKQAVRWGAGVIRSAMMNVRWEDQVQQTFATEIFRMSPHPDSSTAGGYTLGGTACALPAPTSDGD
jgi:hypothetical protein